MKLSSVILFSSRRRHTRYWRDWSSDVCSSDLLEDRHHEREGGHRLLADREQQDALEALARRLRDEADAGLEDVVGVRSEERRVGKECRSRWSTYNYKIKLNRCTKSSLIQAMQP